MQTMIKSQPKILVTGADGFIGSHLVETLAAAGRNVKAMVLYNSMGSWGWLDQSRLKLGNSIEVVAGDVRDSGFVREALSDCDVVLHLAALIAIPYSYRAPHSYIETNVLGTLNLLCAARDKGVSRFVLASTSEVYGTAQTIPITENHPLHAQSPYAASKIAADQLALSFYHSYNVPVCVIRPFNTYGPRQSARAIIPTVAAQILSGKEKVRLGSSHPTRDFCYVSDTVRGFIAAVSAERCEGEVIQLGTGFEISIGNVVHEIAGLLNRKIEIEIDLQRVRPMGSEVNRLISDPSKAERLLGWRPERTGLSGLRDGLKDTLAWLSRSENLSSYRPDVYQV